MVHTAQREHHSVASSASSGSSSPNLNFKLVLVSPKLCINKSIDEHNFCGCDSVSKNPVSLMSTNVVYCLGIIFWNAIVSSLILESSPQIMSVFTLMRLSCSSLNSFLLPNPRTYFMTLGVCSRPNCSTK